MKMNFEIPALFLGAALMCAAPGWSQQSDTTAPAQTTATQDPPAQDNGDKAKQDMHNAGQDTKDAVHDTANGVKHGTKHAYHKTKRATKKAWHKTKSTTEGAVEGAKEGAQQPEPPATQPQ